MIRAALLLALVLSACGPIARPEPRPFTVVVQNTAGWGGIAAVSTVDFPWNGPTPITSQLVPLGPTTFVLGAVPLVIYLVTPTSAATYELGRDYGPEGLLVWFP